MPELRTVRVAAAQATPAILDAEASIAKAVELIERAAADGAELIVLPETFVPLIPRSPGQRPRLGSTASTSSGSGSGRTRSTCPGPWSRS